MSFWQYLVAFSLLSCNPKKNTVKMPGFDPPRENNTVETIDRPITRQLPRPSPTSFDQDTQVSGKNTHPGTKSKIVLSTRVPASQASQTKPGVFDLNKPQAVYYDTSDGSFTLKGKKYDFSEKLGEGSFSQVFGQKNHPNIVLKVYNEDLHEQAIEEIGYLLAVADSPFPMRVHDVFELYIDDNRYYGAILDRLDTPDLFLTDLDGDTHFTRFKRYLMQGLQQLEYMHDRDIIANDIKTLNMGLLRNNLILYDFGASNLYSDGYSSKFMREPKDLRAFALSMIDMRYRAQYSAMVTKMRDSLVEWTYTHSDVIRFAENELQLSFSEDALRRLERFFPHESRLNYSVYLISDMIKWLILYDFARAVRDSTFVTEYEVNIAFYNIPASWTLIHDQWLEDILPKGFTQEAYIGQVLKKLVRGEISAREAVQILKKIPGFAWLSKPQAPSMHSRLHNTSSSCDFEIALV